MVVNEGYKAILNLLSTEKSSVAKVQVAFSTSVVPLTLEDTATEYLQGTVGLIDVDLAQIQVSEDTTKYPFMLTAAFMNGNTLTDAALLIDNKLIARLILEDPIEKTSSVVMSGYFILQATRTENTVLSVSDMIAAS